MSSDIRAIETEYNGYRFRSRLEARWAIFFRAINLDYEYELEGFQMDDIRYLPDFYIPSIDRWLEIKGQPLSIPEIKKCEEFLLQKRERRHKVLYFNRSTTTCDVSRRRHWSTFIGSHGIYMGMDDFKAIS